MTEINFYPTYSWAAAVSRSAGQKLAVVIQSTSMEGPFSVLAAVGDRESESSMQEILAHVAPVAIGEEVPTLENAFDIARKYAKNWLNEVRGLRLVE